MSACKSAFKDLSSPELQARARTVEGEAFQEATSKVGISRNHRLHVDTVMQGRI
jgi:hypothetical protein